MNDPIPHYERLHGDEWVDEIRIQMVPRWKSSDLSGDEWRTSAVVTAYRDGRVVGEYSTGRMQWAIAMLPGRTLTQAPAMLDAGWQATPDGESRAWETDYCFQPGCAELATVEMRKLVGYSRDGTAQRELTRPYHRRFCEGHKRRGDCGLDDADENYEVVALLIDGEWKPLSR